MKKQIYIGDTLICKKCGWICVNPKSDPKECEKCKNKEFWLVEEFPEHDDIAETWRPQ